MEKSIAELALISRRGETAAAGLLRSRSLVIVKGPDLDGRIGGLLAERAPMFDALYTAVAWFGELPEPPTPPIYAIAPDSAPHLREVLDGPELIRWLPVAVGGRTGTVQALDDPSALNDLKPLLQPLVDLLDPGPSPNLELIAPARRALIFNCDDFGLARATNEAVIRAMEQGLATSATVMMPTPFAHEAAAWAAGNPGADVGIHLTFTNEWPTYNWGPVAGADRVPSLVDHRGFMHGKTGGFEANALPEHIELEARAQIEAALELGMKPNHLDGHMGWHHLHGPSLEIVISLAVEYGLAMRWPNPLAVAAARARGVACPDFLDYELYGVELPHRVRYVLDVIDRLPEGVSEILVHPALAGDEMRAVTDSWPRRHADFELMFDRRIGDRLTALDIPLVGFNIFRTPAV